MALKRRQLPMPLLVLLGLCGNAWGDVVAGHHLPSGSEHSVREREIDMSRVTIDLRLDLDKETVDGSVAIRFVPLRHALTALSIDAAGLDVKDVELVGAS